MNALYKIIVPEVADQAISQAYQSYLEYSTEQFFDFLKQKNIYQLTDLLNARDQAIDLAKIQAAADAYATIKGLSTAADFRIRIPESQFKRADASASALYSYVKGMSLIDKAEFASTALEIKKKSEQFYNQSKAMLASSNIKTADDLYYFTILTLCWLTQIYPSIMSGSLQPDKQPSKQPAVQESPQQTSDRAVEPELVGPSVTAVPSLPALLPDRLEPLNDSILSIRMLGGYSTLSAFISRELGDVLINTEELTKAIITLGTCIRLGFDPANPYKLPPEVKLKGIDPFSPARAIADNGLSRSKLSSFLDIKGNSIELKAGNINNVFKLLFDGLPSRLVYKRVDDLFPVTSKLSPLIDSYVRGQLVGKYFRTTKYSSDVVLAKIKAINPDFINKISLLIKLSYTLCAYSLSPVRDLTGFLLLSSYDFWDGKAYQTVISSTKSKFLDMLKDSSDRKLFKLPKDAPIDNAYLDLQIAYKLFSYGSIIDVLAGLSRVIVPFTVGAKRELSGSDAAVSPAKPAVSPIFRDNDEWIKKLQYYSMSMLSAKQASLYQTIAPNKALSQLLQGLPGLGIGSAAEASLILEGMLYASIDALDNLAWNDKGEFKDAMNLFNARSGEVRLSKYACNLSYLSTHFSQVNTEELKRFQAQAKPMDVLRAIYRTMLTCYAGNELLMYDGRYGFDDIMKQANVPLGDTISPAAYELAFMMCLFTIQGYAKKSCIAMSSDGLIRKSDVQESMRGNLDFASLVSLDTGLKAVGLAMIGFTIYQVLKPKRSRRYTPN